MLNSKKLHKVFALEGEPQMNEKRYGGVVSKKNLYLLTPDQYIEKSAEILNMSFDQVVKTRLRDHRSYVYIERAAKQGKLTIPVLDYVRNNQNGLHRAMWAKEQGFKKIPVLIIK